MKLRPIAAWLVDGWQIYYHHLGFIFKTIAVAGLLTLPLLAAFGAALGGGGLSIVGLMRQSEPALLALGIVFIVVGVLLAIILGMWVQAALYQAVHQAGQAKPLPMRQLYRLAWGKWPQLFLASLLMGLAIVFGLIFLVVPGIIFAVWFALSPYVVIVEGERADQALRKSKSLVSGSFLAVAGRLLVIILLSLAAGYIFSRIRYLGGLLNFALSPYFSLLSYLVYSDLAGRKTAAAPKKT